MNYSQISINIKYEIIIIRANADKLIPSTREQLAVGKFIYQLSIR